MSEADPFELRWHGVAPGADGPELHHDLMPVRLLSGGQVKVWDPYRKRHIDAVRPAMSLGDASTLGVEMVLTIDMLEDARREIEARERDRSRGFTRDRVGDRDQVREIRRRLDDPSRVVHALGLEKGARRQAHGGLTIACPWHDDKTPSCSVRVGKDDTIACKCHGCGASGDVFGLIAAVHRLHVRTDFRRVLSIAADMAGVSLAGAQ